MFTISGSKIAYHSPTVSSTRVTDESQPYIYKRRKDRHITYNPGHFDPKPKKNLNFYPRSA